MWQESRRVCGFEQSVRCQIVGLRLAREGFGWVSLGLFHSLKIVRSGRQIKSHAGRFIL